MHTKLNCLKKNAGASKGYEFEKIWSQFFSEYKYILKISGFYLFLLIHTHSCYEIIQLYHYIYVRKYFVIHIFISHCVNQILAILLTVDQSLPLTAIMSIWMNEMNYNRVIDSSIFFAFSANANKVRF